MVPPYLATGTYDGGVYGGSGAATLDLNVIKNEQLLKMVSTPVISPVSALCWSSTTKTDPLGVLGKGLQCIIVKFSSILTNFGKFLANF